MLLCVQTGVTRCTEAHAHERRLLFPQEPCPDGSRRFALIDLPASAFDNTVRIAEMCDVDLEDSTYHLPDLPSGRLHLRDLPAPPDRRGPGAALRPQRQRRGGAGTQRRELRIITEMDFDIYY